jgi:hypothetical protein
MWKIREGFLCYVCFYYSKESWDSGDQGLRPISLVGGVHKIISKVVANRFKSIMGKIVSSY